MSAAEPLSQSDVDTLVELHSRFVALTRRHATCGSPEVYRAVVGARNALGTAVAQTTVALALSTPTDQG